MGILTTRRLADLDRHLVLAPERYDPRRVVDTDSDRTLGDLVSLSTAAWRRAADAERVLVLDTSHAFEGVVRIRHSPGTADDVGSAKRQLAPGDVIVSRLRPYLRQVALVDAALFTDQGAAVSVVCSTEFYVLRSTDRRSAAFLVPYLLSEPVQAALAASQEGGHHPRVPRAAVLSLPVPTTLEEHRHAISQRVEALVQRVRRASRDLAAITEGDWAAAARSISCDGQDTTPDRSISGDGQDATSARSTSCDGQDATPDRVDQPPSASTDAAAHSR